MVRNRVIRGLGAKAFLAGLACAASAMMIWPKAAEACGGFFCSRTPVDQTAERIIFTVNGDGTITAYVQITYAGDRDNFAWIVPVPSRPDLDVGFPQLAMQGLDLATEPQYQNNQCFLRVASASEDSSNGGSGVTVIAREAVGPFDTVTLEGESAEELVSWLQDNEYRIADSMVPFIEPYVREGMKFLAMKLLPDSDVDDIEPIQMTYQSEKPMIPIRLTTVAAQPEMGVKAWILADRRYAPENFEDLKIPDELIEFDSFGFRNNYLTVVSREVDKVGGHAFVTEYAKPSAELIQMFENQFVPPNNDDAMEANEAVLNLLRQYDYVTRLYTRVSAEEMSRDPMFAVAEDQSEVDNIHNIDDPDIDPNSCEQPPEPCVFTYCGRNGVCVKTLEGDQDACVCAADTTARPTTTANGQLSLYCEPVALNFMSAAAGEATGPDFPDGCTDFDCGEHGECLTINGNPTCACEAGYGAVARTDNGSDGNPINRVTCEEVGDDIPPFPNLPPVEGSTFVTATGAGGGMSGGSGCAVRVVPRHKLFESLLCLMGMGLWLARRRSGRRNRS